MRNNVRANLFSHCIASSLYHIMSVTRANYISLMFLYPRPEWISAGLNNATSNFHKLRVSCIIPIDWSTYWKIIKRLGTLLKSLIYPIIIVGCCLFYFGVYAMKVTITLIFQISKAILSSINKHSGSRKPKYYLSWKN